MEKLVELKVNHRYFIQQGKYLYFGTVLSIGDDKVRFNFATVKIYKYKFYIGRFGISSLYPRECIFYKYIPYKMEEIMLNKILKSLLGDDFFYDLRPKHLENWYY